MEFLQEVGIFFVEAVILVGALLLVVAGLAAIKQRQRGGEDGYIEVRRLNDRYNAYQDALRSVTEHPEARKKRLKADKDTAKTEEKRKVSSLNSTPHIRSNENIAIKDTSTLMYLKISLVLAKLSSSLLAIRFADCLSASLKNNKPNTTIAVQMI